MVWPSMRKDWGNEAPARRGRPCLHLLHTKGKLEAKSPHLSSDLIPGYFLSPLFRECLALHWNEGCH